MSERNEPEWKTRQLRVDKHLESAGWEIVPKQGVRPAHFFRHHALEEFPTENGPADYALCGELVPTDNDGYGFTCSDPNGNARSPIGMLKLHGSVNWAQRNERDLHPAIGHKKDFFRRAQDGPVI